MARKQNDDLLMEDELAAAALPAPNDAAIAQDMKSMTLANQLGGDRWAFTAHPERQRRELGAVTITMLVLTGLVVLGYVAIVVFAGIGAAMSHR